MGRSPPPPPSADEKLTRDAFISTMQTTKVQPGVPASLPACLLLPPSRVDSFLPYLVLSHTNRGWLSGRQAYSRALAKARREEDVRRRGKIELSVLSGVKPTWKKRAGQTASQAFGERREKERGSFLPNF